MSFHRVSHRLAPTLLILTGALALVGCDVEKIDAHFQGPTKLSGSNAAIGGVDYSIGDFGKDHDRHISTCRRADASAGALAVQLGSSGGDLPLTLTTNSSGPVSLRFQSPDGLLTFSPADCSFLKSRLEPATHATSANGPELRGELKFSCTHDGKVIRGEARFDRCGS